MSSELRRLPDGELEVMQALWDCEPPATRADVEKAMGEKHPMAVTTLLTLLTRLGEKGFVKVEKLGRGNGYTPLVSRQDYLAAQSRRFMDKLCGGSISAFAAALCGSGLTKEELAQLRQLLDRGEV